MGRYNFCPSTHLILTFPLAFVIVGYNFFEIGGTTMFSFQHAGPVEWIIVGLGNPGPKYDWTRHNVGFLVIDELADRANIPVQRVKYKALTNTTKLGGKSVLLMKPVTYMNLSGEAVGQAARFYKVPPERVLVISDDVSLPQGKLRIRRSGSAGGHNGLKNIIAHLGTDQFPRLRIGVGSKPHPDYDLAAWVLSDFSPSELSLLSDLFPVACLGIECLVSGDVNKAMQLCNRKG